MLVFEVPLLLPSHAEPHLEGSSGLLVVVPLVVSIDLWCLFLNRRVWSYIMFNRFSTPSSRGIFSYLQREVQAYLSRGRMSPTSSNVADHENVEHTSSLLTTRLRSPTLEACSLGRHPDVYGTVASSRPCAVAVCSSSTDTQSVGNFKCGAMRR